METDNFNRVTNSFTELKIYKARVYKDLGVKDNRLQVRILPHQENIPIEEEENLPIFPCFFSDQVLKFFTEKADGNAKATIIAVVATEDFQIGWILGPLNPTETNSSSQQSNVYPFEEIVKYLNKVQGLPEKWRPENVVVTHYHSYLENNSTEYGLIDMYNKVTGDKVTMLTSGVVFVLSRNKILLRCGVGDQTNPMAGKQFSSISIEPHQVKVSTPKFIVDADKVQLGNNGLNVLGTVGGIVPTYAEGVPIIGVSNIMM